ncbi:MAG: hypothetical protein NTW52_20495, partial [Planctomycetota bacterium]|nr:hypothetical protein [Planctomycetota bacterium]
MIDALSPSLASDESLIVAEFDSSHEPLSNIPLSIDDKFLEPDIRVSHQSSFRLSRTGTSLEKQSRQQDLNLKTELLAAMFRSGHPRSEGVYVILDDREKDVKHKSNTIA